MTGNAATLEPIPSEPRQAPGAVRSDWPRHEADEIEAVTEVLRSGKVNALVHGEQNRLFAREFADYVEMPHGFCVANGTVSLELALRVLGVGPGDEVIVPARSFFATASCVLTVGALPVFADVLPDSQNIDPQSVARLIGPKTRAVICVHLAGWPCEMDALQKLCGQHGLFLIEDCAQAHGAEIDGKLAGSFGDISSFSFCTDKIMSTGGEGGLLLFRDKRHHDLAWSLKDHGKNPEKMKAGGGAPGEFRYIHDLPGTNLRLTEMQAAIGRRQLRKLPDWLARRRANAEYLISAFKNCDEIHLPQTGSKIRHAWYKFYIQLREPACEPVEELRSRIIAGLTARGIPCGSGSCPDMSKEHALDGLPIRRDGKLTEANELGKRTIMLPVDHTLDEEDMERMSKALLETIWE